MDCRDPEVRFTWFQREVTKVSRRLDMHLTRVTEEEIEFVETDEDKKERFAKEIRRLRKCIRLIDIIGSNSHIDVRGNSVVGGRNLCMVDDEYYEWVINGGGAFEEKQLGQTEMF